MNHHAHEDSSQVSDLIYYTSLLHLFLCIQRKNCKSVYHSLSLSLLCALFPPSFLSSYKLDFCSEPQLLIKKKKKRAELQIAFAPTLQKSTLMHQ